MPGLRRPPAPRGGGPSRPHRKAGTSRGPDGTGDPSAYGGSHVHWGVSDAMSSDGMSRDVATALVAWGNAWLTGSVGLDEAVDAVEKAAGPQILGGEPAEVTLRRGLGDLRVGGLTALRLALPEPGDPLGLTGPAE